MEPFLIKNLRLKCTISLGQSNYPSQAQDALGLLKIADESMYKNKKQKEALSLS
jgi:GGDEF domain-containing protein